MKHYYYADQDEQFGPFTIDELKSKRLKKSTLVWTDGMTDWVAADTVEELKDILVSEPPPLPKRAVTPPAPETIQVKQPPTPTNSSKYDLTYEKESEATALGITLLVIPIALQLSGVIKFDSTESYNQARAVFMMFSLFFRIAITFWVVHIASRQNRNSTGWGWFAFFLPSIALIIIGQLKKLRLKIELDGSLPIPQQISILFTKANELFSDNRYSECVELLNKAIEIDSENANCIRLRAITNNLLKNYPKAKLDFTFLIEKGKFLSEANYHLGNLAIIEFNRELSISYWTKAKEQNNDDAKVKLDLYHYFTGAYLLSQNQMMRKLGSYSSTYAGSWGYQGGLLQIDSIENIRSFYIHIYFYDNGIDIELRKSFKSYHCGIAFYEIDCINFIEVEKKLELHLIDGSVLIFQYDPTKNMGLKTLLRKHLETTGKTATDTKSLETE